MVVSLLLVTLLVSSVICFIVNLAFHKTTMKMLQKLFPDEIASAYRKYLAFALYVIGVGGGVRMHDIERYIVPSPGSDKSPLILTDERWTLEMVRTVIETMQAMAWALFLFFLIVLIAYLIVQARSQVQNSHPKSEINLPQ